MALSRRLPFVLNERLAGSRWGCPHPRESGRGVPYRTAFPIGERYRTPALQIPPEYLIDAAARQTWIDQSQALSLLLAQPHLKTAPAGVARWVEDPSQGMSAGACE